MTIVRAIYKFAVPTNYKSTFDYVWYLMQHFYNKQNESVDETWCVNHIETLEVRSTSFNGKICGRMKYNNGGLYLSGWPDSRELELESSVYIADLFPEDLRVTEYALNVFHRNPIELWERLQDYVTRRLEFKPERKCLFGQKDKYDKYYRKDPDTQLRLSLTFYIRLASNKPFFEDFYQFRF